MQSAEDVARAKEGEIAFHARLNAARHEMEADPNPWVRRHAADIVNHMTCGRDARPASFPDDRLWFGSQWMDHRYDPYTPELDRYFNRCRRLWREHVVSARRLGSSRNTKIGPKKARRAKG